MGRLVNAASCRLWLSETSQALGRPGIVGAALLAFSASFASSTLWPARQELQALRAAHANGVLSEQRPDAELRTFYAVFPAASDAPEMFARLYATAAANGLALPRGEYGAVYDAQIGLTRYRIALPVRGSYAQIRAFIGDVLKALPAAALDEVSFERARISERQIDANIRFTLYLRGAT